jgi:poly-gamma-glutamate synthesis protein (capsule biosynthesis protein)
MAVFGLAVLASSTIGLHVVNAQAGTHHRTNNPPVWEEVDREIKVNPAKPAPKEVLDQIVSLKVTYKDFKGYQRNGIIEVNRDRKDDTIAFFKYAYYLNFPIKEVAVSSDPRFNWDDDKLMAADVTSGFNYRTVAGTSTPSQHGIGRAFDVNPRENPYITLDEQGNPVVAPEHASWQIGKPGTLHGDHPLVQLMESRGWIWGGRWTLQDTDGAVIDYQHFQKRATATSTEATTLKTDR